jgi:hypothetical protein
MEREETKPAPPDAVAHASHWPSGGAASVRTGERKDVGGVPVKVSGGATNYQVKVYNQGISNKSGVTGVVLSVQPEHKPRDDEEKDTPPKCVPGAESPTDTVL